MMYPFDPFPGAYQPFLPTPPLMPPGPGGANPWGFGAVGGDTFESPKTRQSKRDEKKDQESKHPWYVSLGKEVVISGLTIAASIAGGAVGGIGGAIAAGSLASAGLGMLDQKLFKKREKLDWNSVGIDAALGMIPGPVAECLAKGGARLLARSTGKVLDIGAKNSVKRGVVVGATDGLVMGSVGGFAQSAYDSCQKDGHVNWGAATKDAAQSMVAGVIGGGLGAGALMRSGLLKRGLSLRKLRSSSSPPSI
jgi:hypothetical protein